MGPAWVLSAPGGPHVGPMNPAIWVHPHNQGSLKYWTQVLLCCVLPVKTPFLYSPLQRSWKWGILVSRRPSVCPSICPAVCGQNRVCSVSSTILAGSISYLHILSSRCVAYKCYCEFPKFEFLAKFWNLWLCLVMTWDLIWIHSMGNHGAAAGILRTQAF